MATYSVNETTKGDDSGSEMNDKGEITFKANRSWQIVASDPGAMSPSVRDFLQLTGSLPLEGDSHPDNPIITCRSVYVTRETPVYYTAKASYLSIKFLASDRDNIVYPWDAAAKVRYRSVTSEAETDEDYDGNVIANPGTDEVIEGVTRRISDVVAVVSRPFIVFSGPTIRTFMDQVNSDSYLSFPAGEGMVQSITADPAEFEEFTYYDVTAEILFRTPYRTTSDKAWYHRRALRGFYEMQTTTGGDKSFRVLDNEQQPVSQPILLDDTGFAVDPGGTPVWKDTKIYGSIAFSGMGFF